MSCYNLKKRVVFVVLSLLFSSLGYAQLSDLHYLPPLKQGANNAGIREQAFYLSTPETTPFTVNVFRGTNATAIATFTVSNASPVVYTLPNGDNNITLVQNNLTGVVLNNSGLRFESPNGENFYVNFRGSSNSQSASLTSKGRSAMGRNFKWGGVPNLGSENSKSNTLGIMATEDDTTIDLFGYDPGCEFRVGNNRAGITADTYQITLDANESFVFETYIGTAPTQAHEDGWIGASIVSDKDIVISNGSMNFGRQVGSGNRDAGIDQPVPENRLGREYVFVRGRGNANGWTEFPLLIGIANNTQIFINGSATPIATINNGEYFQVPSTNYSSNTVGANMYIRTSNDVYAYQCLAGSTAAYTQGLNFVAPINCLLPDTMDNIPEIRDAAGTTITGGLTVIASSTTPNANIIVTDDNGTATLPAPNAVAGNADWKTFYIPNLTGDVSVSSTGPIAVGFFGFNGARGLAGYYSGFDTTPDVNLEITGSLCLPGASLRVVDETFDAYQWYYEGNLIPGATSETYDPTSAGNYYVQVTKGPCSYDSNTLATYYCDPDIKLDKVVDLPVVNNDDLVTFTITVESLGLNQVTNLVISDNLPPGLEFISASVSSGSFSYPNWNIGTTNSGDIETMTLVARATLNSIYSTTETHTNTVTNSQDQIDNNTSTDNPSVDVQVNLVPPTTLITNRRITIRVNKN